MNIISTECANVYYACLQATRAWSGTASSEVKETRAVGSGLDIKVSKNEISHETIDRESFQTTNPYIDIDPHSYAIN